MGGKKKLSIYPSPLYCRIIENYSRLYQKSVNKVVCEAVKEKFESLPKDERDKILNPNQ